MRRKTSSADFLAVFLLTSVFSAAGWLFWTGITKAITPSSAQRIGTMTFRVKNAQRKYTDRAVWETIPVNAPLYSYDSIRTAENSSAVLMLDNGAEIYLDENSLILLDYDSQKRNIEFIYGNMHTGGEDGAVPASASPAGATPALALTVSSKGSKLSLGKSKASLSATKEGGLGVTVTSGSVDLVLDGKKQEIKENEKAEVQAGAKTVSIEAIPISMTFPGADYRAISFEEKEALRFSWKSGKAMDGYLIEVSPNASFSALAASAQPSASEAELSLSPGTYYARVTGRLAGAEPSVSAAVRFHVIKENPPEGLNPPDGALYSYRSAAPALRFLWQGSDLATRHLLEISRDKDFTSVIPKETDAPQASIDALAEGEYWWRVKSAYPFGYSGYGPPSKPLRFSVRKTAELKASEPVLPLDGQVVYEKAFKEAGLRFSWKPAPETQSSTLVISEKDDPKGSILRIDSKAGFIDLNSGLEPGEYLWQVHSLAADGVAAPPSVQRSFRITDKSPKIGLLEPSEGAERDALPDSTLRFAWESEVPMSYAFEISKDPAFQAATVKETAAHSVELPVLEAGSYSWRVSALDPKGVLISRSDPRTLVILKPMEAPVIVQPKEGESMELVNAAGIDFGWQAVPEAQSYSLRLLDQAGKAVFARTDIAATGFRLEDLSAIKAGRYTLELRAVRASREGQRASKPAALAFAVSRIVRLSPPELVSPAAEAVIGELEVRRSGIEFAWKNDPGLPKARFTLSSDSGFRAIISEEELEASKTRFKRLDPGIYFWNVSGVDSAGRTYVSAARKFEVRKAPDLLPPALIAPKPGELVDMSASDVLSFSWKPAQDATHYSIKLVFKKTGALIANVDAVKGQRWDFSDLGKLDVGAFTFSLQSLALDKDGKVERRSQTVSIEFGITLSGSGGVPQILSPDTMYVP